MTQRAALDLTPRTVTEDVVTEIWADLLKVEAIRAQDDFFELGGDSLLAMQAMVRVEQALRLDLRSICCSISPPWQGFATRSNATERSRRGAVLPAITRASRERPLPLSLFQEWIWQNSRNTKGAFTGLLWFRIKGQLDIPSLERSLREVVRRHEALRTTLVDGPEGTSQVIGPADAVRLTIIDVSGSTDINAEVERSWTRRRTARLT